MRQEEHQCPDEFNASNVYANDSRENPMIRIEPLYSCNEHETACTLSPNNERDVV